MRLRNKITGEIGEPITIRHDGTVFVVTKIGMPYCKKSILAKYRSLAELNEEWEDYEEPKEYWYIDCDGSVYQNCQNSTQTHTNHHKLIGNYFETKEEAEKAVEKLKAWKRVKDLGFRFRGNDVINDVLVIKYDFNDKEADLDACAKALSDVILLFGGEE